ncbi:transporter substrate-binding domain-containing protein [Streptomyces hirsutus]|uniref:Transporter substrate-binding domain-containing protein n=1 Tax=Streptomyces hirsutus TaxID=35620 RepID=A0ABZ1GMT5_9ACTN|nr:transporter substrate-binding domain-containing protein [Streptomyces hirsutus]WSD07484.1 transporter substrate-binding domain-containing protein [Streptomyces hirsutus]
MHEEERPTQPPRPVQPPRSAQPSRSARSSHKRLGPVEADTPEAAALAEWLRKRVSGYSLRRLEKIFPHHPRRTQWNHFLNGHKLVPLWILNDVVSTLVPPPERQLQRGVGQQLLAAAEAAEEARNTQRPAGSPAIASPGTVHEQQIRLNEALQGQLKAQETVQSLTHLIYAFVTAMADLNQRCRNLETERDEARLRLTQQEMQTTTTNQQRAAENTRRAAQDAQRLAETEQRLAETEQRLAEFKERLARARREKQNAEDLRIEAFRQAEERRLALEQPVRPGASPGSADEDIGELSVPQPWEYDRFLEAADVQLDAHEAGMEAVREQLGNPAPPSPEGPPTVPGRVITTMSTDSPDNAPTSGNPVPTASADIPDRLGGSPATTPDGPPARSGNASRQSQGGPSPRGGTKDRPRRGRKGLRLALVGATCLAVLAGGGWLIQNYTGTDGASSSAAPGPSGTPEDTALERLQKAKSGGPKWKVGVKREQPGLSEYKDKEWVGAEIKYAKKLLGTLGLKEDQYEFVGVATNNRAGSLNEKEVDIFIGTYGISEIRKKGTRKGQPAVIFAGPYLETPQKIMMQRHPGSNKAMIHGEPETVRSFTDIPPRARVCLVDGSSAEAYVEEEVKRGRFQNKISRKSDYDLCVDELTGDQDVVMTDATILQGFLEENPGEYILADDSFGEREKYGIGLNKNSLLLKEKVCEAMRETMEERDEIYDTLVGGREEFLPRKMTECSPS